MTVSNMAGQAKSSQGNAEPGLEESASSKAGARILIVEDERIVALDLAAALKQFGYVVAGSVSSGEAAIEQAAQLRPNLVLMDIRLAGKMDGIEAAEVISKELDVPVIYLTAHSDDPTLTRAKKTGPLGFIVKPFKASELHCAIEIALNRNEIDARLKEREHWLTTTLKSIGDGVIATDPANRVKFLNRVAEALTGYTFEDAIGRVATEILTLVGKTGPLLPAASMRGISEDGSATPGDESSSLISRTGQVIPIDDSAAPILDEHGRRLGGVTLFRDVTRRQRAAEENEARRKQAEDEIQKLNAELEARVVERTAQLEAANKEMESFSYSVAHDLRAPLRGIDGFSTILIESHTANLGPEGVDCLNRIRAGAGRMRQLIDDLLHLARVSRLTYARDQVDLTQIAKDIVDELRAAHPQRQVEFVVTENVTVLGDGPLLRIALENLLGNAWKFTGKVSAAKIEFGCFTDQGTQVCVVRDNGAGFDMKNTGRLFGAFQRLHTAEDFEGTGIGLAIVERIISRHGGRIWAESAPRQGATFFFAV